MDIRDAHKKDWDTGDQESIADQYIDTIKEIYEQDVKGKAPSITSNSDEDKLTNVEMATVIKWGKKLDLNLTKLTPEETRELTRLITKGSRNPIIRQPSKGRGKKK